MKEMVSRKLKLNVFYIRVLTWSGYKFHRKNCKRYFPEAKCKAARAVFFQELSYKRSVSVSYEKYFHAKGLQIAALILVLLRNQDDARNLTLFYAPEKKTSAVFL